MGITTRKNYCPECGQCLVTKYWCKKCEVRKLQENFDNWTSGSKEIDELIRETQLNATKACDYLEWIPFDEIIGINKYDACEVGIVYTANWKKGLKDYRDENKENYVAKKELIKVDLHALGEDANVFLKELKRHYYSRDHNGPTIRLLGVTRDVITGHFMMVAETVKTKNSSDRTKFRHPKFSRFLSD